MRRRRRQFYRRRLAVKSRCAASCVRVRARLSSGVTGDALPGDDPSDDARRPRERAARRLSLGCAPRRAAPAGQRRCEPTRAGRPLAGLEVRTLSLFGARVTSTRRRRRFRLRNPSRRCLAAAVAAATSALALAAAASLARRHTQRLSRRRGGAGRCCASRASERSDAAVSAHANAPGGSGRCLATRKCARTASPVCATRRRRRRRRRPRTESC